MPRDPPSFNPKQVTATDGDKDRPQNIVYFLTGQGIDPDNPANSKFDINRTTGEIFVLKVRKSIFAKFSPCLFFASQAIYLSRDDGFWSLLVNQETYAIYLGEAVFFFRLMRAAFPWERVGGKNDGVAFAA